MKTLVTTAILLTLNSLHAATISSYDFSIDSRESKDSNSFTESTDFTNGSGIAADIHAYGYPPPGLLLRTGDSGTSRIESIESDDYYSFTISLTSDQQFQLISLQFDIAARSLNTTQFTSYYSISSTIEGYDTDMGTFSVISVSDPQPTFSKVGLDLSAFILADEPITFRIYNFSDSGFSNDQQFIDSVILTATSIPEPSILLLLSMSFVLALLYKKRRPNKALQPTPSRLLSHQTRIR